MGRELIREASRPRELVIKPVERDEELRLANELMAKSHKPDYFASMRWFETSGAQYPGFRREHTRIALWNGEIAGALRVNTDTVRLGEARLKMGGFGWVSTAPRHRHKGVCSALMKDTLTYLREHRYHVSMLFGIPNFYHRFGFVTTLPDHAIVLDAHEANVTVPSPYRVRPVKPGDLTAVQKMHEANDADVPCSLLRSSGHLSNRWEHFKSAVVFTNREGKVLGYVLSETADDALVISEVGVSHPDISPHILAHCAEAAQDAYRSRIRFLVPPGHAFARFLVQYESTHEVHVTRERGGMMAFVDIAEALENMIPEWEQLLSHSALRDQRVELSLIVDRQPYRIRLNKGAIDVAAGLGKNKVGLSGGELMQILTGYRYAEEVLDSQRRILTAEARETLTVLFPKRFPYVWSFDRF